MTPSREGDTAPEPVPLILLTGFLGAGKTTLLNRVLGFQHHLRVAVLVNELGRIDVDAALIRGRAGDVLELAGGCVCHQIGVQRELWSALDDIVKRSRPDVVVLETTGIAEPEAIWDGLAELTRDRAQPGPGQDQYDAYDDRDDRKSDGNRRVRPPVTRAATVTVVDAEVGGKQLDRHAEARAQVIAADRILLSKLDLASPDSLISLHRSLHSLNPNAERVSFPADHAGTAALVAWLLNTRSARPHRSLSVAPPGQPATGAGRHAHHAHQLAAATFVDDAPLLGEALLLACEGFGIHLVRAKGFVHLAGEARRGYLEKAGERLTLKLGEPWGSERPLTQLVLIGEELDPDALHRRLWACRAPV